MVFSVELIRTKLSTTFVRDACYENQTNETWARLERNVDATPSLLYRMFGVYPLIVCIPSLILNISFVYVAVKGSMEKKLPRKLYIFLINRALGDILYLLLTISLALGDIHLDGHFPLDILAVLMVANYMSFWASMVGFISLCLLKLCALVKPLYAHKFVTTRRCILVAALSWLIALAYTLFLLLLMSLTINERLAKWSKCTQDSCIGLAFTINAVLDTSCYFLTLTIFVATIIVSRRIQQNNKLSRRPTAKNSSSVGIIRRISNPLCREVCLQKLALSVTLFALFYSLPTFAAVRFLFKYNKCYYSLGWYRALTIVGSARISFIVRTFIDPIINFCTHRKLREALKQKFTSETSQIRRQCSTALIECSP